MIAIVKKVPLLALFSAAMLSPPLYAADGNINVTGRVVENACMVAAESKNIMVDFGELAGNNSNFADRTSGWRPIKLLDCPSGTNQVKIRFEGTATNENVADKEFIFALDNQGQPESVQNVGFRIRTHSTGFTDIKVNGDSSYFELKNSGSGSENTLEFVMFLIRFDSSKPIPLGETTGSTQFTILYN